MRRAFVSHSTADDSYVAEMESFLRAAGFHEVFNDVSAIRPDEQFWPVIEKGIADADTLVVVITTASNSSAWVKREVDCARGLSKKIIPVWIEDCPIPPAFADRDVIDFRPRTREERRFDISRFVKYAPAELIGREDETKLLNDAWQKVLRVEKGRPHVLTFVALGGEGKTSLVAKWAAELAAQDWPGCDAAFAWSFYSQGTREQMAASSDLFLKEALTFFGDDAENLDFMPSDTIANFASINQHSPCYEPTSQTKPSAQWSLKPKINFASDRILPALAHVFLRPRGTHEFCSRPMDSAWRWRRRRGTRTN
jgi:TIR domain-containing protein